MSEKPRGNGAGLASPGGEEQFILAARSAMLCGLANAQIERAREQLDRTAGLTSIGRLPPRSPK